MLSYGLAIGYALFLWWFSTGLILYLDSLPPRTYRRSLLGASLVLAAAVGALYLVRDRADLLGAYIGFTSGVLIWGWLEMTYYMGFITGPRKARCPDQCGDWRRFVLALQTSLWHELLLLLLAALMVGLTWSAPNQVGTWTFVILWWMRWSAKLNLFFGVPNLNEEWLPDHVRFVTSYLHKRPMNLLFPVSVSVATVVMSLLVEAALDLPASGFGGTALILTATLLALAILEHWFLVLPLEDGALWNWALDARERAQARSPGSSAAAGTGADDRGSTLPGQAADRG
jgi:putative photosynthetic complex assembly protein 2